MMESTTFKPRRTSFMHGKTLRIRASTPSFVSGDKSIDLKPRENAPVMGCGQYSDCTMSCGFYCAGTCGNQQR